MLGNFAAKIFGTSNGRIIKKHYKLVDQVNALEAKFESLDDEALKATTVQLKQAYQDGKTLDELMPEAFAACREAGKRAMGMRHFDVQLIGGAVLHGGNIAEMRTGEGKTLVATLPAYLNALSGDSVHLVTVNDYLAKRDAQWMSPLYEALGLTVGFNVPGLDREQKLAAYNCDIVYGTNNEFGFDYLRDNMALSVEERVQRKLAFAIVDEVDSILIDEARTPLIISGPAQDNGPIYQKINQLIPFLSPTPNPEAKRNRHIEARTVALKIGGGEPETVSLDEAISRAANESKDLVEIEAGRVPVCEILAKGHFSIDEKTRHVELNEEGHQLVEDWMHQEGLLPKDESLYAASNLKLLHHVNTALRAHAMFRKDVDYIVQGGQVVLIDEHTGRTMAGRRLSEGLHQAIEAKEGVQIQSESQTMASTTFQNYFRIYNKLAGMTGTADTEAPEFLQIYGLGVVVVPTNKSIARKDLDDVIYMSKLEKYEAIVDDINECVAKGAPVLVGTASIETSEQLSQFLRQKKIKHEVLNAKFHEKEASIIAQAGRPGAVTIATNMAGRGTDIVLGGNLEVELAAVDNLSEQKQAELTEAWQKRHAQVLDAGGLHVLGTERHESRRIDNQLRGRSGRQGDPGLTRFYLSLEDDLMRIFASDRMRSIMQALGMERGEAIEHRMVTNAIEKAQRKVEGRNFDARKALLEYDDVANDQRQIIYDQRNTLLEEDDISEPLAVVREDVVQAVIDRFIIPGSVYEQWEVEGLQQQLAAEFGIELAITEWLDADKYLDEQKLRERVLKAIQSNYDEKAEQVGPDIRKIEKYVMLQLLDQHWKEHLATMDQLRSGIHLRGYAGKNPKQEYKRESYDLFEHLLDNWRHEAISMLSKLEVRPSDAEELQRQQQEEAARQQQQMKLKHEEANALAAEQASEEPAATAAAPVQKPVAAGPKVGRNDPCPCGSGKKYKQCCGKLT